MRLRLAIIPFVAFTALAAIPSASDVPAPLRGFSPERARVQREWERKFMAIPDPARMREAMRRLSARPHHVGTAFGKESAEWMRDQFRAYGWQAELERFDVLFPTPLERVVELVAPTRFTAKLQEPAIAEDPTSGQTAEQLPTYNAYSADGDVTGPLVFVNYGVPADYDELERRGISVKGAIVIAKYGGSWRGIKPKVAAERGAVGCLIYSDPKDDGYAGGDVYPQGPMRPRDGVQRGSVADMPTYPGDPLTPFVGATKDAKRVPLAQAATITKIPVLPISYADAEPLLRALGGQLVPAAWRGGLPITYRFGPGAARVRLKVKSDWSIKPLYNVIAKLPGTTEADQWVVRGNHHDAWVNGAEDPVSGIVAELEEARALGELYKQGWRPRRTIVYAAWDGEEPGLLGSTEWVEAHAKELAERVVAYVNTDGNGRGYLGMGGSHTLEGFINGVARDVPDPETKVSAAQRVRMAAVRFGDADERREARDRADLRIEALGSGSDFTPFLQHLGVATLNLGFGGEDDGGIYHSIYDSFHWYTRFSDTSFVYGRALSQVAGISVMRLAGAEVLPFDYTALANTVRRYAGELQKLRDARADEIAERNRQVDDGVWTITSDPRAPVKAPSKLTPAPHFNFAPLLNAIDSLERAAQRFEQSYAAWSRPASAASAAPAGKGDMPPAKAPDAAALAALNRRLLRGERLLTSAQGLPRRPWYRHLLYAPGYYTGYGVKTLPAAREAIEQGHWDAVDREVARIAAAITAQAVHVDAAAKELAGAR